MPRGPYPLICTGAIFTRNRGRVASLKPSTMIETVCGRPAKKVFRGVKVRENGSFFLMTWRPRCGGCGMANWADWMIANYPSLTREDIERSL